MAHVPAKVATTLGDWQNPVTMQRLQQQPSGADLYAAAREVGKTGQLGPKLDPSNCTEKRHTAEKHCGAWCSGNLAKGLEPPTC